MAQAFKFYHRLLAGLACLVFVLSVRAEATATNDFYAAPIVGGSAQWVSFVNDLVGWRPYAEAGFLGSSTVVGNIEAGHIWTGHEVFRRPPSSTNGYFTYSNAYALNELDFHATMVGHVLAGAGFNGAGYSFLGLGMAPDAAVLSGSVATNFSTTSLGSFGNSYESVITPYRAFMTGEGVPRAADVINSSWGGQDPAAMSDEAIALDGLAAENRFSALFASAGNSTNAQVGWPGAGFNAIAVGALGGMTFLSPAGFTSRGLVDFYNPETATMISNARVAVDIAAPASDFYLAAYLGNQGGLAAAAPGYVEEPSPTNNYFYNQGGTSFSSPLVAGAVAVLKDVANRDAFANLNALTNAKDTRVVKSVLMAGALETFGWDNAQTRATNGAVTTTMALDRATGAGALDMGRSGDAYFFGTRDVPGTNGGVINGVGWDFGTVGLGTNNDYIFAGSFIQPVELTVSLNWFAGRSFDMETNLGSNLSFADLNLEVWEVTGGSFSSLVASSSTTYNNSEYLRLDLLAGTTYGLRVRFDGMVFDQTELGVNEESYGLAWVAAPYETLYWKGASNGTWSGLSRNWGADPGTNAATDAVTTALDQLVIAPGTNASIALLIDGPQMARSLSISNGLVTLGGTNGAAVNLQNGGLNVGSGVNGTTAVMSNVSLFLSGEQAWTNASSFSLTIAGMIAGQGDLALRSSAEGGILSSGFVNHSGALVNSGTGSATNRISGVIGTNVTSIYQQSATSRLVLSGSNSFTGTVHVDSGTLELSGAGGALSQAAAVGVSAGATLLFSSGGQVNDSAIITLSGGTILRGSGVSEVFGNLHVTQASFLDFGSGSPGTLVFGLYTPSALLSVNNFLPGNTLVFGSDLSSVINDGSLFSFSIGFNSTWSGGNFTITAIPEAGTWIAAALLIAAGLFVRVRNSRSA